MCVIDDEISSTSAGGVCSDIFLELRKLLALSYISA